MDDKPQDSTSQDEVNQSFAAAIRAVESSPDSDDAWVHLEEFAESIGRLERVGEVYLGALKEQNSRDLQEQLAERAVGFYDEWFGDEPDTMARVLNRVIEIDEDADWAFERLTQVLMGAEQWDNLFAAYDRALKKVKEDSRRIEILEEVSDIAKDIVDDPDRALEYLTQLQALDLENTNRLKMIERLLERRERWDDLVELWRDQISVLDGEEMREMWLKIIDCYLSQLSDPRQALDALGTLLGENPGYDKGCKQLEFILDMDDAPREVRFAALDMLVTNYNQATRQLDGVAAIKKAIEFAETSERQSLHRRAGAALASQRADIEALEQYSALLLIEPSDSDALKQLRVLSVRARRLDIRAEALFNAAQKCDDDGLKVSLLADSAQIYSNMLNEPDRAIEIFNSVMDIPDVEPSTALMVAHNLNELFGSAGRSEERLEVLERLAVLENNAAVKRTILQEVAQLAMELGDPDRALTSWTTVLENNGNDLAALSAVVDLMERTERWEQMVEALRRRAEAPVVPEQRRADLVVMAELLKEKIEDSGASVEMWKRIVKEFGPRGDALEALDELLSDSERWEELAALFEEATGGEYKRIEKYNLRLGDLHRLQLQNPKTAVRFYSNALALNPMLEQAQDGLKALVDNEELAPAVIRALLNAYEMTSQWSELCEITDARLEIAEDDLERARILLNIARLEEEKGAGAEAAQKTLLRALPLDPDNQLCEYELNRLAEKTGEWESTATTFSEAALIAGINPIRQAQLKMQAALIKEQHLDDLRGALDDYIAVTQSDNRNQTALRGIIRVACKVEMWSDAGLAFIDLSGVTEAIDGDIVELLQTADGEAAWRDLLNGIEQGIEKSEFLKDSMVYELETMLANWFLDECDDLERAETAARRAVESGKKDRKSLEMLAGLQRRRPSEAYIDTLMLIYALEDQDIDAVWDAAETAMETVSGYEQKRSHLLRLYEAAEKVWIVGAEAIGERTCEAAVDHAIVQIVDLDLANDKGGRAAQLLLAGAKLPFGAKRRRVMRRMAAHTLSEHQDVAVAIEIYNSVLGENPDDAETLSSLGLLLEKEKRWAELLTVRLKQLELKGADESKVELRLEISKLAGVLEGASDRIQMLKENLEEQPGHSGSLAIANEILSQRAQYQEMVELFSDQATKLAELGEQSQAGKLWFEVARVSEENLRDHERAIDAYTRVGELEDKAAALDALARLHTNRGEINEAAKCLEKRLAISESSERVSTLLRLARAQIEIGQSDQAVANLEEAFENAPRNAKVRKLLLEQYRALKNYEALAQALSTAASSISDNVLILAYVREAADIYFNTLDSPDRAVPALRQALELAPDDQELKIMLAHGLYAIEELGTARDLLTEILEGFGRRRSSQRAAVHMLLAEVERAQDNLDEAIVQLELATKMDAKNPLILKLLAERAKEKGDLVRAEKAYRSLLLIVRREQLSEGKEKLVGPAEVLLELSWMAGERDQKNKADELCESALEALSKSDVEMPRIQAKLKERGDYELLMRLFETRLSSTDKPRLRAKLLAGQSEILEGPLERPEDALELRLLAVEEDPGSPIHHDAAENLAEQLSKRDKYIAKVESLLEKVRRDDDVHNRCELLLRLIKVLAWERDDLDGAWDLYKQAEETGVREIDVWRAGAKLAAARNDDQEQVRLLKCLSNLGEQETEEDNHCDVMYRLAEIQMASPETSEEGLEAFEKAFIEDEKGERAGRIMRRACENIEPDSAMLTLYEKVARRLTDDNDLLLDYLERRAVHFETTPGQVREGAELAMEKEEYERAEKLLRRIVELGGAHPHEEDTIGWALLGLARRRMQVGDLAGAIKWLLEAGGLADSTQVLSLGREIAGLACQPEGDKTLAVKMYERLIELDSSAREAWEPLAGLYLELGNVDGFESLVEETMYSIEDPQERSVFRLMWAKLLLTTDEREADAVEVLKNIQLDDPGNEESLTLLTSYFEKSQNYTELFELLNEQFLAARERGNAKEIKSLALELGKRMAAHDAEEARGVYRTALETTGDDQDLLCALLEVLVDEESGRERVEVLERMLGHEEGTRAAELSLEVARAYHQMEDGEGELRALKYGLGIDPEFAGLREEAERYYRDREDYLGLAALLRTFVSGMEDPADRSKGLREIAGIYREQLGDVMQEIDILLEADSIDPQNDETAIQLAVGLSSVSRYDEAAMKVSELLSRVEDAQREVELLVMRGELFEQSGNMKSAVDDFETAFEIDPESVAEKMEKLLVAAKQSAFENGGLEAERGVTIKLVGVYEAGGRKEEVEEILRSWVERNSGDVEVWRKLLALSVEIENWNEVVEISRNLIDLTEGVDQIELARWLCHACEITTQFDLARDSLEKVFEGNPENPEIRSALKKVYEAVGAYKELAGFLSEDAQVAEDDTAKAKTLKLSGEYYLRAEDEEMALTMLRESLALVPSNLGVMILVVDILIEKRETEEAGTLLDNGIAAYKGKRSPGLAALLRRKAMIARVEGNRMDELGFIEKATQSDRNNGETIAELATLAEELEQWDLALKTLRSISLLKIDCPVSKAEAFFRLGKITHKTGETKRAILYARSAIKENPDYDEAKAVLAEWTK
jgi:tetratricopeptide (TPR) repeat protein